MHILNTQLHSIYLNQKKIWFPVFFHILIKFFFGCIIDILLTNNRMQFYALFNEHCRCTCPMRVKSQRWFFFPLRDLGADIWLHCIRSCFLLSILITSLSLLQVLLLLVCACEFLDCGTSSNLVFLFHTFYRYTLMVKTKVTFKICFQWLVKFQFLNISPIPLLFVYARKQMKFCAFFF